MIHSIKDITDKLYKQLSDADTKWIHRKRKITTASIFSQLSYACIERRGLNHTLLKSGCDFSHQAFSQARRKLPQHVFADINKALQNTREPRIFAIDGSKIHVHPTYLQQGCTTRTNKKDVSRPAKRPLIMLSSMLDVNTRTCYDSQVTTYFNERKSALEHFKVTRPGDTVIFDRGYFSQNLFLKAQNHGLKVVFRLKCDALKSVKEFFHSSKTFSVISVLHDGEFSKAYLYKYFIDGKKYICITNFETSVASVKELYALRWKVETSFRRLKTDLCLESAHSSTKHGFVQELEARILFDTFAVLTTEKVSSDDANVQSKKKFVGYFHALDAALRIFHAIQIIREQNLTRHSLFRILRTKHPASSSNLPK